MELAAAARGALRKSAMSALAPSLESYFTDRLVSQRAASPNTIAAYALTFRLLLAFASARTASPPDKLDIAQLDAPLVGAFLEHLERDRHNTAATRNMRLAAIHSLFSYLALHHPEHAGSIPASPFDPAEADRVQLDHLPRRGRGGRIARGVRSAKLDRAPRSRDVRPHDPDRAADLRARRAHVQGRISSAAAPTCIRSAREGRNDAPRSFRARSGVLEAWLPRAGRTSRRPALPDKHREHA